ncbi:FecR family protein [Parabacteroides sp. GYB001]|uniref:FecR family protein n=2 Tax=Parabacteroides leei TaxID=2939491 RepID=UPI002017E162|nr:FecR family protein [Parabacteroides leei]MCL3853258.1 FecR family protein [Parabacteroides leei]
MEKEILYKFFDGKASREEKEAIRIWLETSEENEQELFREREFFDAMILSGDTGKTTKEKKSRPFYLTAILEMVKLAAVLAIAITCGTYAYKSEIKKIRQAMNTITVPAGQRVNLTLPDGTNVWLNACSEMKYPAAFTGDKREITLNGEAYFEVTHNADKPFLVQTNKCNIEVLGTKFNVEAYNDSKDFCTSLLEGSVKIVEREKPSDNLILTPNQQATLVNGHLSSEPIADFDLFRWKEGLICFRNMHFKELMTRFEKCYGIHIIIENTNLADYVCSGKFRISDGIDKALSILQKDAQYTFIRSKDDSAIYIK